MGEAIARDRLAQGAAVATFSREPTKFIEQMQLEDPERKTFYWDRVDGSDPEQLKRFVLGAARHFGSIDALVNNAAVGSDGLLTLMRPDEIHRVVAVNLEGAIHLTQCCAKVMLTQNRGNIVSISSVNAIDGHAGVSVYSATKAALDGLTRSLARELGPAGIRVNSLAPGYFESDMVRGLDDDARARIRRRTPLGRLATVDDIVAAVRFLLGEDSRFITGQTLVVDGGFTT